MKWVSIFMLIYKHESHFNGYLTDLYIFYSLNVNYKKRSNK